MFPFLPVVLKETKYLKVVKQFVGGVEKFFLYIKPVEGRRKGLFLLLDNFDLLKEENLSKLFPFVTSFKRKHCDYTYHIVTFGNPKGPYILVWYDLAKKFVGARFVDVTPNGIFCI